MPIREYIAKDPGKGCGHCRHGFEVLEKIEEPALEDCPKCGASVYRCISSVSVSATRTNLDDRAKSAGFTKYKRLGKGEYEKQY